MFRTEINNFYNCFGDHKSMVLSTEQNSIIHSRMMSVICFNGKFYFQTDKSFRKCKDIEFNSNVALCTDNIQIEGIARQIGSQKDNIEFCRCFEKASPKAFENTQCWKMKYYMRLFLKTFIVGFIMTTNNISNILILKISHIAKLNI